MSIDIKLNKPFPFVDKGKDKLLLSLFFALFIYTFLILFQPFGIAHIIYYKPIFILGYAGITFLVMTSSFFLYPKLAPHFDKEKWTVSNMFIYSLFQILSISIFNWIYTATIGQNLVKQHSFIMFIFITFSVGIMPTLFLILLLEHFLNWRNEDEANKLTHDFSKTSGHLQNAFIALGVQHNKLSLSLADLLCIKAEGNYVEIYTIENTVIKKHLVRCPLSKIKAQLVAYHHIKHCHRSFIVNTQRLIKATGNARNFNLHLNHLDFSIPVSRSFPINTIKK